MSGENKVRCTYPPCGLFFNSSDEMQSHKASADKHHYCLKHDLDFPNPALLHLHKILSDEHFACAECELELRSQAGLNHHVKMTHQGGKEVACLGCGRKYKSAAAVMKHIEDRECPNLSLPERGSREGDFDIIGGQSIMEMGRSSPGIPPSDVSSEDEDDKGGVLLDIATEPDISHSLDPGAMLSSEQWPKLGSMGPSRSKSDSTSTESTGGVSLLPIGSLLDQDIPISSPIKAIEQPVQRELYETASRGDQDLFFLAGLASPQPNAHGNRALIDPENFWNEQRRRYICNCNASFSYVSTFMHHIAEEDDSVLDCPRCGKRFPTHAARVAHVEAPFSKCAVRVTHAEMERELSEITRGFAEIKGHDQQSLEDMDDVMESSQPSNSTHGYSNDDTLEDAVDTIEEGSVGDEIVEDEVLPDEILPEEGSQDVVLQDALEYVIDDTTDEDTLVQDLGGLVFSTKEAGDEEKDK